MHQRTTTNWISSISFGLPSSPSTARSPSGFQGRRRSTEWRGVLGPRSWPPTRMTTRTPLLVLITEGHCNDCGSNDAVYFRSVIMHKLTYERSDKMHIIISTKTPSGHNINAQYILMHIYASCTQIHTHTHKHGSAIIQLHGGQMHLIKIKRKLH